MLPLVRLPESVADVPVIAPIDTAPLRVALPDTVRTEAPIELTVVRGADTVRLSYNIVLPETVRAPFIVTLPEGSRATAVKF
jgi:hypothetical protein